MAEITSDPKRGLHFVRNLSDGREVCMIVRMFNTILTIGPAGAYAYDDQW